MKTTHFKLTHTTASLITNLQNAAKDHSIDFSSALSLFDYLTILSNNGYTHLLYFYPKTLKTQLIPIN